MNFTEEMKKKNITRLAGIQFLNTIVSHSSGDKTDGRTYIYSNLISINSLTTKGIRSRTTGYWLLIRNRADEWIE